MLLKWSNKPNTGYEPQLVNDVLMNENSRKMRCTEMFISAMLSRFRAAWTRLKNWLDRPSKFKLTQIKLVMTIVSYDTRDSNNGRLCKWKPRTKYWTQGFRADVKREVYRNKISLIGKEMALKIYGDSQNEPLPDVVELAILILSHIIIFLWMHACMVFFDRFFACASWTNDSAEIIYLMTSAAFPEE